MDYVIQIPGRALFVEYWDENNWCVVWTDNIMQAYRFETRDEASMKLNEIIINGSSLIGHYKIRGVKL